MAQKWDQSSPFYRLLAATVAATNVKLNYHDIANMFGQGATYDSIEGRFRKVRKDAAELRQAQEKNPVPPTQGPSSTTATSSFTSNPTTPTRKTPRKARTPRSGKTPTITTKATPNATNGKVFGSRITKRAATPGKAKMIKREITEDTDEQEGEDAMEEEDVGQYNYDGSPFNHVDEEFPDLDGDFNFANSQI